MKFKSVFAPIKEDFYEDEEGNLIIPHSIISDEIVDRDGEIVTAEAMKNALDKYMQFANIREMHQPVAIGKTLEIWQEDKKTLIKAKIVAEEAIKKIKNKVLMGFSIGFKVLKKVENIFTEIEIFEISAVDIPSNYSAMIGSKSYEPLLNLQKEEENMVNENENKDEKIATDIKVEVDSTQDNVSEVDLQAVNTESLEILESQLKSANNEIEVLKAENATLKVNAEEALKDKEVVKSFKGLKIVSDKYKEENATLKSSIEALTKEITELKAKEVNIKSAGNSNEVVTKNASKEVDYSQFEVSGASGDLKNAASFAKALILANMNK